MYAKYFGLSETPFSITPDPHFLYLSRQHREALAHLLFGVGTNGGFVQLTGEVGTGKTTVCRAFLEQLPEQAKVALILNPSLDVSELLTVICEEFQIPLPPEKPSNKELVDLLNRFLLKAHAHGLRPVLMIDEAQNLSIEVLEQIRLLTNLETAKQKLLQIFLVGQPELKQLLEQEELRQVAQRITARYHLKPLDGNETEEYIGHRLAIAGSDVNLFSKRAIRRIHRFSQGVPRLINILCDRSLLGAYATHKQQVNATIVARAARELMAPAASRRKRERRPLLTALFATLAIVTVLAAMVFWRQQLEAVLPPMTLLDDLAQQPAKLASDGATRQTPSAMAATNAATGNGPAGHRTSALYSTKQNLRQLGTERAIAMRRLFQRWGVELPDDWSDVPCRFASSRGLRCLNGKGSLQALRLYNRPTVLEIRGDKDATPRFVTIIGLDESRLLLDLGTTHEVLPVEALDQASLGRFTLVWEPPGDGAWIIADGASPKSVVWLRHALNQLPGVSLTDPRSPVFDQTLRSEIIEFQNRRGLSADGIAGPNTLILLNTASRVPGIPTLNMAAN